MWWIRHWFLCAIPHLYATSWLWILFDDHDVGREAVSFGGASSTGKPSIWIWFQSHFLCDNIGVYWSVSMIIGVGHLCLFPAICFSRTSPKIGRENLRFGSPQEDADQLHHAYGSKQCESRSPWSSFRVSQRCDWLIPETIKYISSSGILVWKDRI